MKSIKVLGTGCASCKQLESLVRQAVAESGQEARVEKVEEIQDIVAYNVLSTPALVVDEVVKLAGRLPSLDEVREAIAS